MSKTALKGMMVAVVAFVGLYAAPASAAGCPSGYTKQGDKCVKYSCRSGCTYVGNGKCRCPKRLDGTAPGCERIETAPKSMK